MSVSRFLFLIALILSMEVAYADSWSCTVRESKEVTKEGIFGEGKLSPAIDPHFETFTVETEPELSVNGGPFNLPDNMHWTSLQKDPAVNGIILLGTSKQPVRWRFLLVDIQSYVKDKAKPFFATDGGGWQLYSGLCVRS